MSRNLSRHTAYYRKKEEAERRHEILMRALDPDWDQKQAESRERERLLSAFIKHYAWQLIEMFGREVYTVFWHHRICAGEGGKYDMPLAAQKEVLNMIDRVGVEKFFSVFVEEGYNLDATMAAFAPEWSLDEWNTEYRLRQQEMVQEGE